MDVSTHGKSSLRPVKSFDNKEVADQNLRSNLINIWRVFIYISITSALSILLINNGWKKVTEKKIYIHGNNYTSKEKIMNNINIELPLISINPKYFESILLDKLPIKAIRVNKRILPFGIHIEILERKPVALATRHTSNGNENGLIDNEGYWIADFKSRKLKFAEAKEVIVDGWTKSHQESIAQLFRARKDLGSPLKKIILKSNGEISLETKDFKSIHLGSNQSLVKKQIGMLPYLINSLPDDLTNNHQIIIDIKDPDKPKLLRK